MTRAPECRANCRWVRPIGPPPTITTSSPKPMPLSRLPLMQQARGSQKLASWYETASGMWSRARAGATPYWANPPRTRPRARFSQ